MKTLIKILSIFISLLLVNCEKCDCVSDLSNELKLDKRIYYNQIVGCSPTSNSLESYVVKFNSMDAYLKNTCTPSNISFDLGFNGIVLLQGVKVPYVGPNPGDQGYTLNTEILKDSCNKKIDFKFIITMIDTSRTLENIQDVIVSLNGIDSSYEVNFSHEIIPFKE